VSFRAWSVACLAVLLASCGSSKITTAPPPANRPTPEPLWTEVTIRAGGLEPEVFHIFDVRYVKFVNADTQPHTIFSDKHPAHDNCHGVLNGITLQPGEERTIENLPVDACFFHDEARPDAKPFQGTLVVH
jgi:hypothetical protein